MAAVSAEKVHLQATMPSSPPATRVLVEIPELLEQILYHLTVLSPADTLVSALRVCKTWSAVITSHRAIQEHLFFLPVRSPRPVTGIYNSAGAVEEPQWSRLHENQLLQSIFPVRVERHRIWPPTRASYQADLSSTSATRPAHYHGGPFRLRARSLREAGLQWYSRVVSGEKPVWLMEERFSRPEASWRRMLACQPDFSTPARRSRAVVADSGSVGQSRNDDARWMELSYTDFITHEPNLRMGYIYDKAKAMVNTQGPDHGSEEGPFGIRLEWGRGQGYSPRLKLCVDGRELATRESADLIRF
ncbi:uncharacterized protein B0I36DRAFT_159635 [Microdochium trichocladiopsis]|uniref:F-box domain-containing protein n=1 Tax=Microdochium trichocladiopsis TaxID=1682393 RepID=A0A9P8Y3K1_9PEZI|nr:uncharacterized protein B0I36DRAFT_159635 [Microdochium trichocladiopsis]KAH7026528.1 hypothetical protein B0I36DRAFT_159635 [Microdochium trichocladiopsis]